MTTDTEQMVEIGTPIVYTDERGVEHYAVCTQNWGAADKLPSINLVHVSDNEGETDQYGRQIKRATSVVHETNQTANGRKWRFSA